MGECFASWEMNRSRRHVPDYDGNLTTSWLHVGISSRDVNSIRQGCHIIRIWSLSHDVQPVIRHHSPLGTAMLDD